MTVNYIEKFSDLASTVCSRDYKGFSGGFSASSGVIEIIERD